VSEACYSIEEELVNDFCVWLHSEQTPWSLKGFSREFNYKRGKSDVVAVDTSSSVIAVEAKLNRWRHALQQAYRNTSYAHESYVLLPKNEAMRAFKYHQEFIERSVGLCYMEASQVEFLITPSKNEPIQEWLSEQARTFVGESNNV
jgi:hypothetical protein